MRRGGIAVRAVVALSVLLAAGCGGDDSGDASPGSSSTSTSSTSSTTGSTTSTSAPSTTAVTGTNPQVPCSASGGSSPSAFDPAVGQYAVMLTGLDAATRTVEFDVVQFLVGDDAVAAYQREFPDDPEGPPNDYYVLNESPMLREAPVDEQALVRLVRMHEDSDADLDAGSFDELPTYLREYEPDDHSSLSFNPFWLTLRDGTVTEICEQFVP